MRTLTIKINEQTDAGKAFMSMSKAFFKGVEGIEIIESSRSSIKSTDLKNKIPNSSTLKALNETDEGIGLYKAKNLSDLFDKLEK
mgnify:CR=1 FL=1